MEKKMKERAVIFTGNSIRHEDAKKILRANYQPPVRRFQLEKFVQQGYKVMGIIDGIFFDRAAVGHREIISALNAGIKVVGGASMGALRASELDTHGMIGVGKVYEWYRDGVIESDDEVAVSTNPDTFEPISVPLVNIRETLKAALATGLISEKEHDGLLELAINTYYPDRSYLGLTKEGAKKGLIQEEKRKSLLDFCINSEVDLKRQDAVLVLETVKKLIEEA
ncbi:TfuA domain protein core [Methanosarcina sp. 2.H.T.1A.6]|nr:TfuA domain protein core [Methanosarcina sp. 2.H.T.1A.15]KKG19044.1 TfuA domain protein core [Methanosarcina sp. 2.H.T.1A.3]KKG20852.1 TfuA domain protein core [Methanosarcina sp. 2.H.T.1A.6]KKG22249.1 TfuA domain protein core [Methanosarcina sp. 2.H.T.1A.8]